MGQLVVVIEDDRDSLEIMRDALEGEGYRVIPVSHPGELGTLDPDISPDLFLIDVMLPQRSGIEVAQDLRKGFGASPMIAMSASSLLAGAASGSGVFDDVMDKPVSLAQLLECVELYAGDSIQAECCYQLGCPEESKGPLVAAQEPLRLNEEEEHLGEHGTAGQDEDQNGTLHHRKQTYRFDPRSAGDRREATLS